MTYAELHKLVDRLNPDQANAVGEIVRQLVATTTTEASVGAGDDAAVPSRVRRLSFAGMLHSGRSDLSERSEGIIREEFGRPL